jgi:hypothetical protein
VIGLAVLAAEPTELVPELLLFDDPELLHAAVDPTTKAMTATNSVGRVTWCIAFPLST